MQYKRNWAWESTADIFFTDGTDCGGASVTTDNKGRLQYLRMPDGKAYEVNAENLDQLGIESIHYSTPAKVVR